MKLTRKTLMERAGLNESLEGTLSFWNGKWRVSYTQPGGGDVKGDQAPELDASQVPYAVKNKAVIEKNRGIDVEFEMRNGKAFLLDLPINEDTEPTYSQSDLRNGKITRKQLIENAGIFKEGSSDRDTIAHFVWGRDEFMEKSEQEIERIIGELEEEWNASKGNYSEVMDYLDELEDTGGLEAYL